MPRSQISSFSVESRGAKAQMDSSACYQGRVKVDMTHASATNLSPGPGYNPSHRAVPQQAQSAVSVVPPLTALASWGGRARLLAARRTPEERLGRSDTRGSAQGCRQPLAKLSPILCL